MLDKYLTELVSLYPPTHEQERVLVALQYVQKHCKKYGLKTSIQSFDGVHNLYAHPHGSKSSTVMLQAHIDVVPTSINDQKLLRVKGDKLYGRGSFDMLFAIACYMHFIALHHVQIKKLDVALLLSGDEELGGQNGVKKMLDAGYSTGVCILPDAGSYFGSLTTASKGVYMVRIRVNGAAHHGARPWDGDGAAGKLVRFLDEFSATFNTASQDESTLTIATLQAGDAENRGPSTATTDLDIRYKDKADLARILDCLDTLLAKYTAEVIRINTGDDYQLKLDDPYVSSFITMYRKHYGKQIVFEKAHGSSDARYFSDKNIPVILCRPNGGNAHGDNEWISRASLQQFYRLLEQYVLEVAKMESTNE